MAHISVFPGARSTRSCRARIPSLALIRGSMLGAVGPVDVCSRMSLNDGAKLCAGPGAVCILSIVFCMSFCVLVAIPLII